MQAEPEPQTVDLREFFSVIRRRKWSVILVTLVVVSLAVGMVYRRTPTYTSTADISLQPLSAGANLQGFYVDAFVNMATESRLITSDQKILGAAAADPSLGLDPSAPADLEALSARLSASVPANTTILGITCTDTSPTFARDCANAVANAYVANRIQGAQSSYEGARKAPLELLNASTKQINALTAQLATAPANEQASINNKIASQQNIQDAARLQLLQIPTPNPTAALLSLPATLASVPSNKDYVTTGILAMMFGLALGVGLAFVRERMDERIAGSESLESAIDAPVLAVVPKVQGWRHKKDTRLVSLSSPESAPSEAYKSARTTIAYLASREKLKVLLVTSTGQGEGKTTTTANLAVALAQAGRSVVAVSCDLRKPRLHRFFKLANEVGVSNVLTGQATLEQATRTTDVPGLDMIPSGAVPSNPAELLGSSAMQQLMVELHGRYDIVIVDTAPALAVSDALSLAPFADGVIVVADANQTTRAAVVHLCHQFERVGARIVGGILNNLDPRMARRYPAYDRSYYSGYRYRESGSGNGKLAAAKGPAVPPLVAQPDPAAPREPRASGPAPDEEMWR